MTSDTDLYDKWADCIEERAALLQACRDAANQLRTVAALLNHIPAKYTAAISPVIRYSDIDAAIAKAEAKS